MKIYTSYFGRQKMLREQGIVPVSISLQSPRFFSGPAVKDLAPTYATLKLGRAGDTAGYTREFRLMLQTKSPQDVVAQLEKISKANGGADVAICCYEIVTDFCHRHIVADWLTKETGLDIREFGATNHYEGVMMVQRSFWD